MTPDARILECQDCGDVVRRLSAAEQQKVATDPYNYIVYCFACRQERRKDQRDY